MLYRFNTFVSLLSGHFTYFRIILYSIIFRKYVQKRQLSLTSTKNNGYFTQRPTECDKQWSSVYILVQKWVPPSRNHTPSQVPLAGQHNVGTTRPVSTTRHTHWPVTKLHHTPKANTPLHLNFRSARHYTQHYTTTETPCLEYSWLKREPHNL
jgi:hypothetical protein